MSSLEYDVWINCAAGDHTPSNPRAWSHGIARDGYNLLADRLAAVSAGRTLMFHNPFGRSLKPDGTKAKMEWDQQLNTEIAGCGHIVDSFAAAVRQIKTAALDVIVYLGAPHNTPRMTKLLQNPAGLDNWWWNWWRSLQLPLELGCDIAIDNMGSPDTLADAELLYAFRKMLMNVGRELYIEATPELNSPMFNSGPMIVLDDTFIDRHVPPQHPGARGRWPVVNSTGWYQSEVLVLLQTAHYPTVPRLLQRIADLNTLGVTPMISHVLAERLAASGEAA